LRRDGPKYTISLCSLRLRALSAPLSSRRRLAAKLAAAQSLNSRRVFVQTAQRGARSMRAAVSAPAPHCYSRRRATLLDARHVFDHAPQRRLPPMSAGLRAAAFRRPARRSAVSAFAPACRAASSGIKTAFPGFRLVQIIFLLLTHVLTSVAPQFVHWSIIW
jgi:hypothetical protein